MKVAQTGFAGELTPGELIGGRYRIESTLGHGGMGAVYRVFDERSARHVALKHMHPPQQDQAAMLGHFEREYHTLCQLAHPSIIEVYDYGVEHDSAFYTMELLSGEDLRALGTVPWRKACALLRDVASSLAILHSRKLLHRDISARNVRCTADGRAKLIDFGAMSPMGVVRHIVGTPPFLPPESIRLQVLDGRSDLYALGALAYWSLTGRYAYAARSVEHLPELWRSPPPSPRYYQPDIPEPLERLVMELLELEPASRPSTAAEVMERLCGVAGLELTELPGVARAYLVTPMLVGREAVQRTLRVNLELAAQGRSGCSVLLEGAPGTGRTRMLAAAALQAKLLGSIVLRADAADSASGEYGVAKTLCRQLFAALPGVAQVIARPWLDALSTLLPELASGPLAPPPRAPTSQPSALVAPKPGASLPRFSMLPSMPVPSERPLSGVTSDPPEDRLVIAAAPRLRQNVPRFSMLPNMAAPIEVARGGSSSDAPAKRASATIAPGRNATLPRYSMVPNAPILSQRPRAPSANVQDLPERRVLQSALRDFFLAVSRRKSVVIAVDDLDRIDEPSAALLGMLCHRAKRRRLALVMTAEAGSSGNAALALVREATPSLSIGPLTSQETDALLRSVFGDVDHVTALSERIHQLASGNPRWTMALAERLVERGVARYEAGSWQLPREIAGEDLPDSIQTALAARIRGLDADARELAEALALTEAAQLEVADMAELLDRPSDDHGQIHRALDTLVIAGVLVPAGDRHRFANGELRSLLRAAVEPERARRLHARIAAIAARSEDVALEAKHLMLAGDERAAIERLFELENAPVIREGVLLDQLLEQAVLAAERLNYPPHLQLKLRAQLAVLASEQGQYHRFVRHAPLVLSELAHLSGLTDLDPDDGSDTPLGRWYAAQQRAQERHAAHPEHERGLGPREATDLLIRLCGAACLMAAIAQRLDLVAQLPSLAPIGAERPEAAVTQAMVDIQVHLQQGRFERARAGSLALLERLAQSEDLLPPEYRQRVRWGQLYMLGLFAAVIGATAAREAVAELEHEPGYRSNAWRVRMVYELMHGNQDAASSCRHRAELLNLQDSGQDVMPGTTARIELQAYIYSDDVIGLKRTVERIESLAVEYPGWQPTLDIAKSHYRRLQGDYEGALLALQPALLGAEPGRHFDWGLARLSEVALLTALGRTDEAIERGLEAIALAKAERLHAAEHSLQRVTAEALAKAGRPEEAEPLADAHITRHLQAGARGVQLGLAYEARARVAIAKGDEAALRQYAELCAQEYRGGKSVTLNAKYKRLMREAEAAGLASGPGPHDTDSRVAARSIQMRTVSGLLHTASSRMLACVNDEERALEGLRMLLEAVGAQCGYLFRVADGHLEFLAGSEGDDPPAGLIASLEARLARELAPDSDETTQRTGGLSEGFLPFTDSLGRDFEPLALFRKREGHAKIAALAALHYAVGERTAVRRDVLDVLVAALVEHAVFGPPEPGDAARQMLPAKSEAEPV